MNYYKKSTSKEIDSSQKTLSDLPFDERNNQFMARKQSNLAQIIAETEPDFKPRLNPTRATEQTGSKRLAKLHADQLLYEERKQMRALKLS